MVRKCRTRCGQGVGQETVQYVSNIYKYYVAYKLTLEEAGTSK